MAATLGDFLDKPIKDGGLAFSRFYASALLAAFMVVCVLLFSQKKAGEHPDETRRAG